MLKVGAESWGWGRRCKALCTGAALCTVPPELISGRGLHSSHWDKNLPSYSPCSDRDRKHKHTGLADHHCSHTAKGLQVHCVLRGKMVARKGLRKMGKKAQKNCAPRGLPLLWYQLPLLHPNCIAFLSVTDVLLSHEGEKAWGKRDL